MRTVIAIACCAVLAGCGAPVTARRSAIPVLVYRDAEPKRFARDMDRLHDAGYDTITLATFTRFLRGQPVRLPRRPVLLTLDHGRRDTFRSADEVLRERGLNAVGFVDVGRVAAEDPAYLRWGELSALQRTGRWDMQLESGTGRILIRFGPGRGDVGPFYAYRGADEVIAGWRERVFGDISAAERQLARRVDGYRPLAFAPPYGNYGQAGTNDPEIPRLLLARLHQSFPIVFVDESPPFAARGTGTARPVGRLEVDDERDLRVLLREGTG